MERTVTERLHGSWRVNRTYSLVAVLLAWALLAAPCGQALAAQLLPEIQADLYEEQLKQRLEEGDFEGAKETMDQILMLKQEHGLEIPDVFYFQYAEVSQQIGLYEAAVEALTRYLTQAGQEGEHYQTALTMLIEARGSLEDLPAQPRRPAGETRVFDGMEFVWVPAGEFQMGSASPEASSVEQPVTQVRIRRGFWLGKYEVTQAQWEGLMGSNPSFFDECGARCPVERVSWNDVQSFIGNLNARSGENRYRLPTEAEWEYAARAGTSLDRYGSLNAIAWYEDNSGDRTQPVGQKEPNAWELHDMLGNVFEWVGDWYGGYPGGTVTDPGGAGSGSYRVARGGGLFSNASFCRSSYRLIESPGFRFYNLGFRLLRTVP